jgi:uncharacterized repeat protein (TIGR01451 family)
MLTGTALASGTAAGTVIQAKAVSLNVHFVDGAGVAQSKSAAADLLVEDWTEEVAAIHGLLPGTVLCPAIAAFAEANHGVYDALPAASDYVFNLTFRNRSNESVTADVEAALIQAGARWSITDTAAQTIVEDSIGQYYVTVNSGTALAFERVTVNITASITEVPSVTKNVVSYNVFDGAIGDNANGGYGGDDDIPYYYILEAEGFDLSVITRSVEITSPQLKGYTGGANDPVPGAKIKYTIAVKNNSSSVATAVDISDVIPNNCHLYFNDTPTVEGEVNDHWVAGTDGTGFDPTSNATAAGATITFKDINISANETITLNYTVTID